MADIVTLPNAAASQVPLKPPRKPQAKRPSKVYRADAELVDIATDGYLLLAGLIELVQLTIHSSRDRGDDALNRVDACAAVLEQALGISNAIGTLLVKPDAIESAQAYRYRMFGCVIANVRSK